METSQLVAVLKPDVLASVLKGLRPRALSALLRSCRMAWESFQETGGKLTEKTGSAWI